MTSASANTNSFVNCEGYSSLSTLDTQTLLFKQEKTILVGVFYCCKQFLVTNSRLFLQYTDDLGMIAKHPLLILLTVLTIHSLKKIIIKKKRKTEKRGVKYIYLIYGLYLELLKMESIFHILF